MVVISIQWFRYKRIQGGTGCGGGMRYALCIRRTLYAVEASLVRSRPFNLVVGVEGTVVVVCEGFFPSIRAQVFGDPKH